jgi:hypothetical protein
MKKFRSLLLLITVLSFGLHSCQKDIVFVDGSGPGSGKVPNKAGSSAMSAKVDGKLTNFKTVAAQQVDALGVMAIAGSSDTENISITIADYSGAKAYDIEKNSVLVFYIKNSGLDPDKDYYIGTVGNVTITSVTDKLISGTFNFSGGNLDSSNNKVITEGKFTCALTKQ